MRKDDKQIEQKRRERFEVMAVRLAQYLNMSQAEKFADLPPKIREHFDGLKYADIVRPLIAVDRTAGFSVRQLSIKYGLSLSAIHNHISK